MKRITRDATVVDRPEINTDKVASVYSGRVGACCCGCAGVHTYASKHVRWSGRYRGYSIVKSEVNDRIVKLIAGKVSRMDGVKAYGDGGKSFRMFSAETETRVYIVYMKQG